MDESRQSWTAGTPTRCVLIKLRLRWKWNGQQSSAKTVRLPLEMEPSEAVGKPLSLKATLLKSREEPRKCLWSDYASGRPLSDKTGQSWGSEPGHLGGGLLPELKDGQWDLPAELRGWLSFDNHWGKPPSFLWGNKNGPCFKNLGYTRQMGGSRSNPKPTNSFTTPKTSPIYFQRLVSTKKKKKCLALEEEVHQGGTSISPIPLRCQYSNHVPPGSLISPSLLKLICQERG